MLPDRSKRYASVEGDLPRLTLAENWQLVLIALIMVGLLAVIFPHKALVEKLYHQENLDELTLSYIENLHRTEPENVDLSILVGRARRDRYDVAAMEQLAMPVLANGDARQHVEACVLLLGAYERELGSQTSPEKRADLRVRIVNVLQAARRGNVPPNLAGTFATSAFRVEQPEIGLYFLNRIAPEKSAEVLVRYARESLGSGRYSLAAEYFLLARRQVKDRDTARQLFQEGIGALMAASLFREAMQAAESNLGDLADDPATLRYLARTALAAGDPARASSFVWGLVFNNDSQLPGTNR